MPPMMNFGNATPSFFEVELIYSLVIIVCSLMVYFGTKEIYELSSHKGVKYFRQAFLFFAFAYFFRTFIKLSLGYFDLKHALDIMPRFFVGPAALFVFMYFVSAAIFYLLYSVLQKKWENSSKIVPWIHISAILIACISLIFRGTIVYLGINILLFLFVIYAVYLSYKNSKKKSGINLYIIYLLLLFFSILNVLDVLIPNSIYVLQLVVYLASSLIFLLIAYKVLKKVGVN